MSVAFVKRGGDSTSCLWERSAPSESQRSLKSSAGRKRSVLFPDGVNSGSKDQVLLAESALRGRIAQQYRAHCK